MEKFAFLNLLKAIDGLKSLSATENEPSAPSAAPATSPPTEKKSEQMPNIMYETLMRHEAVSNRLRNKK